MRSHPSSQESGRLYLNVTQVSRNSIFRRAITLFRNKLLKEWVDGLDSSFLTEEKILLDSEHQTFFLLEISK